jgi:catechol 2,3-dioxygenase-like lactoylglutathione lyase family enzyme
MAEADLWTGATPLSHPAIDHIGIVVHDIAPTIAWLRGLGFRVSDPVALHGPDGPLGQHSAHCIFANGYIEISAPLAGSGNHLEPLLAQGEGIRILALRSHGIAADYAALSRQGLAAAPPQPAARTVLLANGAAQARFSWFAAAEVLPGVITAIVEHHDAPIVFAQELTRHPNGALRLADVLFGKSQPRIGCAAGPDSPAPLLAMAADPAIAGFSISGLPTGLYQRGGFAMRTIMA